MWVTTITAVLKIDVRNPFDKLVIQPFGVASNPANLKPSLGLQKNEVWQMFKEIAKTRKMTILLWSENAEEVHRLHALSSGNKMVHEIELLAKLVNWNRSLGITNETIVHFSFNLTRAILNMREPELFATQQLNDAKLLGVIPITEPKTKLQMYQVSFDGTGGRANTGSFTP